MLLVSREGLWKTWLTSYASLYFCLLAGADIEQAEDEEALDYEHEAPRSTYFADLADDSSDDTDDDEITGSAPGTPPDSHSSRQPSRDLDSAPPSRSPSRSPSVESIQRPMPRGPVQPLQLALGLWLERSGASRQDYITHAPATPRGLGAKALRASTA
jgi:hypothetical protein